MTQFLELLADALQYRDVHRVWSARLHISGISDKATRDAATRLAEIVERKI
jgi:hypothetical protein